MVSKDSHSPLCRAIDYTFKDNTLLKVALTHKSAGKSSGGVLPYNNERLEFLGDAVLSLVTAEYLYAHESHFSEGELSKLRSQYVCQSHLSENAKKIELGKYLVSDKAMRSSGSNNSPAILSDTLEALFGAVFIDAGLNAVRKVIFKILGTPPLSVIPLDKDAKTRFQEMVQSKLGYAPKYELLEKTGPAHAPTFLVGVKIDNKLICSASGENKKQATQNAASIALGLYLNITPPPAMNSNEGILE